MAARALDAVQASMLDVGPVRLRGSTVQAQVVAGDAPNLLDGVRRQRLGGWAARCARFCSCGGHLLRAMPDCSFPPRHGVPRLYPINGLMHLLL